MSFLRIHRYDPAKDDHRGELIIVNPDQVQVGAPYRDIATKLCMVDREEYVIGTVIEVGLALDAAQAEVPGDNRLLEEGVAESVNLVLDQVMPENPLR